MKFCKYFDCGFCYNPESSKTNSTNGECNSPLTCPSFCATLNKELNSMKYKKLTDEELIEIAVEEEFLLFCDQDSFNDIARHIEHVVLKRLGNEHE